MSDWDDILDTNAMKIFWGGEIGLVNATESTTGGRKVKFKLIRNPAEQATLNPFAVATLRRNKRAGTRFTLSMSPLVESNPPGIYEVMLLAWGDNPQGSTVTLLLDHEGEHPFMRIAAGARFMAAFVELADDDTAVDESQRSAHERTKQQLAPTGATHNGHDYAQSGQKLSNQAAILCKSKEFQDWLQIESNGAQRYLGLDTAVCEENTTKVLKRYCGVASRSELDTNPGAAAKFTALRSEFNSR